MKSVSHCIRIGFAAALLAPIPALAQEGDPAAGKTVFNKCRACHEAETDRNKVGPSLLGVIGRTAGTLESFQSRYSPAMKEAGEQGLVWDEENLAAYLRDPKGFMPGNKMAFAGLKSDEDIANVTAYLKADPKP
ncbi:c-type cytochrome [Chelativorans salis]|uniref:Cytochrome c family protein n=1 Tax=Chelativorans salis TaxID=2978478 RepID=A0ABT2LWS3_9HYPH|nr:cytochrome c family protein [Chelativorans sp. EGI FJ00035]MCT7377644.1 cytochrome c family protein [Chelativorans sp. EGI FJ00035]